ncbi:hypothetical protein [Lentilactobacillus hilgardii]|nr:hypothetical protein [Lentilactobacillus hilgardii]
MLKFTLNLRCLKDDLFICWLLASINNQLPIQMSVSTHVQRLTGTGLKGPGT